VQALLTEFTQRCISSTWAQDFCDEFIQTMVCEGHADYKNGYQGSTSLDKYTPLLRVLVEKLSEVVPTAICDARVDLTDLDEWLSMTARTFFSISRFADLAKKDATHKSVSEVAAEMQEKREAFALWQQFHALHQRAQTRKAVLRQPVLPPVARVPSQSLGEAVERLEANLKKLELI
jgi:hypothetical protein